VGGDIDHDESKPPLTITNTDSGWTHAITISGDAYLDDQASPRMKRQGGINSLNSDVFSVHNHIDTECALANDEEDIQATVLRIASNIRNCHMNKYIMAWIVW